MEPSFVFEFIQSSFHRHLQTFAAGHRFFSTVETYFKVAHNDGFILKIFYTAIERFAIFVFYFLWISANVFDSVHIFVLFNIVYTNRCIIISAKWIHNYEFITTHTSPPNKIQKRMFSTKKKLFAVLLSFYLAQSMRSSKFMFIN